MSRSVEQMIDDVIRREHTRAVEIYRRQYYEAPGIDLLPARIRPFMFDAAIHHGPGLAICLVQEVCNAAGFGPLAADGHCGASTLGAAAEADRVTGDWLLAALVEERRNFYLALVERHPEQRVFLRGWLSRLAEFGRPDESRAA
jgi:lysozyme family protein